MDNPFLNIGSAGSRPSLTQQQIAEQGNAIAAAAGRHDVHWFVHEGRAVIGFKRDRPARPAPRLVHSQD